MKVLKLLGFFVILGVCLSLPVPQYEEDRKLVKRRRRIRRPCGKSVDPGRTFGNTIVLGDLTVVSCGHGGSGYGAYSDNRPGGLFNKPGGLFNKPGGHKPGGLLSSIFGSGGILGYQGGNTIPIGNYLSSFFGNWRPQLPGNIGLGSDTPHDEIVEDSPEPVKPVFEEIPEDPVTELYKPLPLVGATSQNVNGYPQDLSNFKPTAVISQLGRQFNAYLINPFIDLFT